jgi:antitoxin (DNA-binding transcriptional repressor) of toxin-antitoxin stability system
VAAWIEEGESAEITKAGKVIARLMPATRKAPPKFKIPDNHGAFASNFR